jgi:hypothetical protein
MTPRQIVLLLCLLACAAGPAGCGSPEEPIHDEAQAAGKTEHDFPADAFDYFADMDLAVHPGTPADTEHRAQPLRLDPAEIKGRNTWMLWTGGNEAFWDWLANHSYGYVDFLKLVDYSPLYPWQRFKQAGLIVEPGTRVPSTPDRYGLYIRQPVDEGARQPRQDTFGRSSGIVGLRLFRNPSFDAEAARRWDAARYYNDPTYYLDPTLVRPYRIGMACGFCHVAPNPLNPPSNVEEPHWSNLSATLGNQYLRTRQVFGNLLTPDSYLFHVLDSQLPGTLDTSLISSDNINNANAENAIWELGARFDRAGLFHHRKKEYEEDYRSRYGTNPLERAGDPAARTPVLSYDDPNAYANPRPTPRVLIDGSDSIGPWMALARVYLNIGTYHQRWVTLHNPLFGFRPQKPFRLADARAGSVYWRATEHLMDDLAKYLMKASWPMRLRDAPGGQAHVKGAGLPWTPELDPGRRVFASRCIVCHSSKQPKIFDETPDTHLLSLLSNREYQAWANHAVDQEEFWRENYLSTDRRLPVSLVKTNASRALASNGIEANVWAEFSSETYKRLPPSGAIQVWNPFKGKTEEMPMPGGGRGYYRPASLVSVWATAPLLHNNSVGLFNNDPAVEGRVAAFKDAIHKLLTSGRSEEEAAAARWRLRTDLNGATPGRLERDHGVIWRLPQAAWIRVPSSHLPFFFASTLGWPLIVMERLWLVPLAILVLATVFILIRRRLLRRVGYGLAVVAFLTAFPAHFIAGHLMDLSIGPFPGGLPVDVVANIDPQKLRDTSLLGKVRLGLRAFLLIREISAMPPGAEATDQKVDELGNLLHAVSKSRDYVMDRGHYFGQALTEQERQDLIDLLLTF